MFKRRSQIISKMQKCLRPHTFLMTQIRNDLRKWHQGSTVFFLLTSPNLRTKITRVPCRRLNEGSFPRAEKFGDLRTVDHKVFNEEVNLETITDTQSPYKTWQLSGFNPIRTKQSRHRRRKRVSERFSSRRKSRKSFTPTIHWNFGKACEEWSWSH